MKKIRAGVFAGFAVCALLRVWSTPLAANDEPVPLSAEIAKAEAGDVQAMVNVAQHYAYDRDDAPADYSIARGWYEKAAAKGNSFAAYQLAQFHRDGRDVEPDVAQAFQWMQRAAQAGLGAAQFDLAIMHEEGTGTRKNLVEALKWFVKAAEQGDAEAAYRAGVAYADGRGTKPDVMSAMRWLQRAAHHDHEQAWEKIGELRAADPELGAKLLAAAGPAVKQIVARAQAGDATAQVALAKKHAEGEDGLLVDEAAALVWWQKAAAQGNAEAEATMGMYYLLGDRVEHDLERAKSLLRNAAQKKHPEAFYWLGIAAEDYGDRNVEEAAQNFRRSAELGHVEGQTRWGQMLEGGVGVEKNEAEALTWYLKAAERGDARAMLLGGILASTDDPAVRDLNLARNWLERARGRGFFDADVYLDEVNSVLEQERLAKEMPPHVPENLRADYIEARVGDGPKATEFAQRYLAGRDGLPRDPAQALDWMRRAAEAGDRKGMELLGDAYLEGVIVPKNIDEAVRWLGQSADIWGTSAAVKLADLYLAGRDVPKSETEAARWLQQVAVNDRDVMWRLSRLYAKGLDGGAPLVDQAEKWLNKAAALRQPDAEREIARVSAEKEAARLAQAKAAADEKFAEAHRKLETDFASAATLAQREQAVREFSQAVATIGNAQRMTVPAVAERVLQTLLPKMEARIDEAGPYMMAIYTQAFDKAVMDRMTSPRVRDAVKTYSQRVVNEFNAKQQALGPIQSLIPAAQAGDVQKQIQIGDYLMQQHAAHDPEGAARWYKRAADAGNALAKQKLQAIARTWLDRGLAAYNAKDYATALTEYRKAAEAGAGGAQFNLGGMYFHGLGLPQKDHAEAVKWYRLSAEQGTKEAMHMLAHMLRMGMGVPADETAALAWYRRAGDADDTVAKEWAAVLGAGTSPADRASAAFEKGRDLLQAKKGTTEYTRRLDFIRYAAKRDHAEAKALLAQVEYTPAPHPADQEFAAGFAAFEAKHYDEALRIWTAAAAKGHPIATFNVGTLYENGTGMSADTRKAAEWYEKAVALNYPNARPALAKVKGQLLLADGLTAYNAKNFADAKIAWEQAAELGNADATYNLGVLYVEGQGVERNYATGLMWYEKAAERGATYAAKSVAELKHEIVFQEGYAAYSAKNFPAAIAAWEKAAALGSIHASYNLGAMTEDGQAFEGDLKKALGFYERALAGGHQKAADAVAAVKQRLVGYDELQAAQKARAAKKDDEALAWFEKAAAAGSEEGARMANFMKAQRVGLAELKQGQAAAEEGEFDEAIAWYTKAAEAGNVTAMTSLAALYQFGRGVDEDPRKAIAWYEKAEQLGDSFAGFEAESLFGSLGMFDLMASQPAMKKLRDQIDGVATAAPTGPVKGPKSGLRARELRKRSPWTAAEIQQALKDGAAPHVLANVLEVDKTADNFTDLALKRLMNSPEGQRLEDGSRLVKTLYRHARQGGGTWTAAVAKSAIEARRQQTGRLSKTIDSPELRTKAAAGDVAALFALVMEVAEADLKHGPRPQVGRDELAAKILAANYVPGYWLVADTLRHNPDKSKNDPVRRAALLFESAAAGSPRAMRELAMEFMAAGEDVAIAGNYLEAEFWLIEAAARAPEGMFNRLQLDLERDVAFLYAFQKPLGGATSWAMSIADEPTLRWARELLRRGGDLAEVAEVSLEAFEKERTTQGARARMNALPPEVPLWSASEVTKLEAAAKAGDAAAALKLAEACASGRGVRQNDVKAVALYQLAAAKGEAKAMRALALHHARGRGVKKDLALQASWLEQAGAAGDTTAWFDAAEIFHFWLSPKETGYPRALALYEKAIAAGDVRAFRQLAMMHELGRGVPADLAKAEQLLTRGATAGETEAQMRLGSLLFKAERFAEAAVWYGKAADSGQNLGARLSQAEALEKSGDKSGAIAAYRQVVKISPDAFRAQMQLGLLLKQASDWAGARDAFRAVLAVNEEFNTYRDWAKSELARVEEEINPTPGGAVALRKKAEGGDPQAMVDYARLIAQTRRDEALEWLKKAAEGGHHPAMLLLSGELMPTDKPAALEWMRKSAAAGNSEAKYRLGHAMFAGKEVPLDQAGGLKLVMEASDAGFAPAQYDVGRNLVLGGAGLPAQPAQGVELLKKAAGQGLPAAMAALGELFERGASGVPANPSEALKWYNLAYKAGLQQVRPAIERLQIVLSGKTPPPKK